MAPLIAFLVGAVIGPVPVVAAVLVDQATGNLGLDLLASAVTALALIRAAGLPLMHAAYRRWPRPPAASPRPGYRARSASGTRPYLTGAPARPRPPLTSARQP